jgi:hypothetical protein
MDMGMGMGMDLHGLLLLPLSAAFFALLLTVRALLLHHAMHSPLLLLNTNTAVHHSLYIIIFSISCSHMHTPRARTYPCRVMSFLCFCFSTGALQASLPHVFQAASRSHTRTDGSVAARSVVCELLRGLLLPGHPTPPAGTRDLRSNRTYLVVTPPVL